MEIKKLESSDLELAQALLRQWALDDAEDDYQLPSSEHLNQMLQKQTFHTWVARDKKQVVGGLTAYELAMFDQQENEIFLYEIGVSEVYRNKGVATQLIDVLKSYCRSKGIKVIFVGTSLDNIAAKKLYEKTGGELEVIPWYTYNLNKNNSN